MAVKITNNASTTLSSNITSTQTTLPLATSSGAEFPSPVAPDWAPATIQNAGGTIEIVKITSRSGDTLTVVRGQEGTTGFAFSSGDKVELRITAATMANKLDTDTGGTVSGALAITGAVNAEANVTLGTTAANTVTVNAGNMTIPAGGLNISGGTLNATSITQAGAALVDLTSTQTLTDKTVTAVGSTSSVDDGSGSDPFRLGFRDLPISPQVGNYQPVLTDAGKAVYLAPSGTDILTIPANATTAFPPGTVIGVVNDGVGTVSIVAASGVTIVFGGGGVAGNRSLATTGFATCWQVVANRWYVFGPGVS